MTRVMLVEDHWLWAGAVAHHLEAAPGVTFVGNAVSCDEALALAERSRPNVALVDLILGEESGLYVARRFAVRGISVRTVILTAEPQAWAVTQARDAGLAGFVAKAEIDDASKLIGLVEHVAAGGLAFSSDADALVARGSTGAARFGLTSRELEVIGLLARGLGTEEIAARLSLAPQSVRNKVRAIGAKLNVSGRGRIVAKALSEGLAPAPGLRA